MKYTTEQINELDGVELRAAVEKHVFGRETVIDYRQDGSPLCIHYARGYIETLGNVPAYEKDANAMMQVMAEMERRGCEWSMRFCCLCKKIERYVYFEDGIKEGVARFDDTKELPRAVAQAALLYVAAQGEKTDAD